MKAIIPVLMLALFIVACSSNSSGPNGTSSIGTQNGNPVNSTIADSKTPELMNLLTNKTGVEYKVSYDITTTAAGQTFTIQKSQYVKTENESRSDSIIGGIETRSYVINDDHISCSMKSNAWSCQKINIPNDPTIKRYNNFMEQNVSDYDSVSDGTREIAGVTAACFNATQKSTGYTYRYCFKDGALLYNYVKVNGVSTEVIATSYSANVPDSDFVPPAQA